MEKRRSRSRSRGRNGEWDRKREINSDTDRSGRNRKHDNNDIDRKNRDYAQRNDYRDRDEAAITNKRSLNGKRRITEALIPSERQVWGNVAAEEEALKAQTSQEEIPEEEKAKPNFGITGALAKDARTGNAVKGVVLKWSAPLDAAMPIENWRVYVFKGEETVETLHLHRKDCFLFGRDHRVVDVHLAHPSCSLQHAVIQFRSVEVVSDSINKTRKIKPYLMDLGSSNKTKLNGSVVDDARYYELRTNDLIQFADSSREYVIIKE